MAFQQVALILSTIFTFLMRTCLDLYLYMVHEIVNALLCIFIKIILVEFAKNLHDLLYSSFLYVYVTKLDQLIICNSCYQMSGGCMILCVVWCNLIMLEFIISIFTNLIICYDRSQTVVTKCQRSSR